MPETTVERIARMRKTHCDITESDGGECQMMTDYAWACDEIERLHYAITDTLPWLEKAAPLLNTSAPWERLRDALKARP